MYLPSTSVCSLFAQLAGDDEWLQEAAALDATATCHVRSSLTAAPKSAAISRRARHAPLTVKLPLQLHNYQAPPLTQVVISRNTPSSAFLSVINCSFDLSKTHRATLLGLHPPPIRRWTTPFSITLDTLAECLIVEMEMRNMRKR